MNKPTRIQLSRKKGWRMPPNTVKVDRTTPWGNPFIVGEDDTHAECVRLLWLLAAGFICYSKTRECIDRQHKWFAHAWKHIGELRGKNLACWCRPGDPCHADILLEIANA